MKRDDLTDTVSVKDFGAAGDGVTDDTLAIQSALDAGMKKVVIPDGIYIVSNCVKPYAGQEIEIRGTLKIADANIQSVTQDFAQGQSEVKVADAGDYRVGQWVTVCDDDNRIQVGGRQVRPAWADCSRIIAINGNTLTLEGKFVKSYRVAANARLANQSSAILINQSNIRIHGSGIIDGNKARQLDAEPFVMEGCELRDNGGIGDLGGGEVRAGSCITSAGRPASLENIVIEGLTIRDAIVHNICLTGLVRSRIINTVCTGAHDKNITLLDCEDCIIRGNVASFSDFEDGIMLHQKTGNKRIIIQGNLCLGNPRGGIHVGVEESEIHLNGNMCVNNGCNISVYGRNCSLTGDVCMGENHRLFERTPDKPRPGVTLGGINLAVSNLNATGHSLLNVLVRAEDIVWNGGVVQGVDGVEDCVGLSLDKAGPYPNSRTARRVLIQGIKIRQCATGVKIHPETSDIKLVDNAFDGNKNNVEMRAGECENVVLVRNKGFMTENSGLACVPGELCSVTVKHGLDLTPALRDIMVTPLNSLGQAHKFWIANATAESFDIMLDQSPGDSAAEFAWRAAR